MYPCYVISLELIIDVCRKNLSIEVVDASVVMFLKIMIFRAIVLMRLKCDDDVEDDDNSSSDDSCDSSCDSSDSSNDTSSDMK